MITSSSVSHPGDIHDFDDEKPKASSEFVEGEPKLEPHENASNRPQDNQPETNQPQRYCMSALCGALRKNAYSAKALRKFIPLAIFIIMVIIITTTALVFTRPDNNEPLEQESDPVDNTKTDAAKKCERQLRHALQGIDAFRLSADAPQSMATEWLAVEDNACEAELNVTRLEQRYALLTIYFGMSLHVSIASLVAPGTHECDWVNIGCNSAKQVTEIELTRVAGTLLEEIALLSSLSKWDGFDTPRQVIPIVTGVSSRVFSLPRSVIEGRRKQYQWYNTCWPAFAFESWYVYFDFGTILVKDCFTALLTLSSRCSYP